MRRIALALGRVSGLAMTLSQVALVVMAVLITVEVLGRNLLSVSTLVADEMAGYLLVAITFLGLGATLRTGGFIRIDTYRTRARGRTRGALDLVVYGLGSAYTAVLAWYGWRLAWDSYGFGTTSISVTRTPLWIPQCLLALGLSMLLFELVAGLGLTLSGAPVEREAGASIEL